MTSIGFLSIGYLLKSKPPLNRLGCLHLAPGRPDVFCRPIPASQPRTPHAAPHSPRMVRGPSARAAVDDELTRGVELPRDVSEMKIKGEAMRKLCVESGLTPPPLCAAAVISRSRFRGSRKFF